MYVHVYNCIYVYINLEKKNNFKLGWCNSQTHTTHSPNPPPPPPPPPPQEFVHYANCVLYV